MPAKCTTANLDCQFARIVVIEQVKEFLHLFVGIHLKNFAKLRIVYETVFAFAISESLVYSFDILLCVFGLIYDVLKQALYLFKVC